MIRTRRDRARAAFALGLACFTLGASAVFYLDGEGMPVHLAVVAAVGTVVAALTLIGVIFKVVDWVVRGDDR